MKLLIATFNQGKLEDYKNFVKDLPLEVVSLHDLGITEEFEETFQTMEENAKAKAEHYHKLSNLPTLSDDSGIEIPYYNMEPGANTKYWGGFTGDTEGYRKFILEKVRAIPEDQRQAQFRAVLAYADESGTHLEEGVIKGVLTENMNGNYPTTGYPWRPMFLIPELNKYYIHEELTPEENRQYNHRGIAFERIKKYFKTDGK